MIKKAEGYWFIVSVILVIITLAVLILIYASFPWKEQINQNVCKATVVSKATLPEGTKNTVPLKCQTKKICFTSKLIGKGECKELGDTFDTIRVTGTTEQRQQKMSMEIARQMATCWNMMGEGLLQVFNREISAGISSKAVVCTKIEFDKTITNGKNNVTNITGFSKYLLEHKVPSKQISYWDYFRNAADQDTLATLIQSNTYSHINDFIINTNSQQAILYMEFGRGALGKVIGGATGATLAAAGSIYLTRGSILLKAPTAFASLVAVSGIGGGYLGDKIAGLFSKMGQTNYMSGIFLTEYSMDKTNGFGGMTIDSFENIA